jgi:hypothetical protein
VTQLSGERRRRRRHRWYEQERPTLLVRLRLVGVPADVIDSYKEQSWTKRDSLRRAVHWWEARNLKELTGRK